LAFEVARFTLLAPTAPDVTLETYLKQQGYSAAFFEEYLLVSYRWTHTS
jgi:predicted NAD/FAD-binding protein